MVCFINRKNGKRKKKNKLMLEQFSSSRKTSAAAFLPVQRLTVRVRCAEPGGR